MTLLEVKDLHIRYQSRTGDFEAVRGVSFDLKQGEIITLVGESGSGKSSVASAIGRLTDFASCEVAGEIIFKGESILRLNHEAIRKVRQSEVSYVFQEPASSLNPVFTIQSQIMEAAHSNSKSEVSKLLETVHLKDTARIGESYPHQLSGGMKQRAMIAMALAKNPSLLIADEPTTALDVTIQKGILGLFMELKKESKLSILFITHDLRIAFALSDRILVMKEGKVVEELKAGQKKVSHSYSRKLLNAASAGQKPKTYLET